MMLYKLSSVDVVGLYPSIPHELGALEEALGKREYLQILTSDIVTMAKYLLQNNYFEFNGEIKQQISGTAIGTKFAPPYSCILMDHVESEFLKTQIHQPLVWFRYIHDIFFIWSKGQDKSEQFLVDFNKFLPTLKFIHESSRKSVTFLDVDVKYRMGKLLPIFTLKLQIDISISITRHYILSTPKGL